jgi:hypothetical protein
MAGDVTEEGEYVTPYRDPYKRFGVSLGKNTCISGVDINKVNVSSIILKLPTGLQSL